MFAGEMKLKHFLGLAGLGGVVAVAGLGLGWWSSAEDRAADLEASAEATQRHMDALPDVLPVQEVPVEAVAAPEVPTEEIEEPAEVALEAVATAADPPAPSGRPVDQEVLSWVGRDLGSKKKKDVTKGRAYKVNVYQDDGHATANRAKVDLDRDDRWDEKITFHDDGTVSRKVSPGDDEDYTETSHWSGTEWVAGG